MANKHTPFAYPATQPWEVFHATDGEPVFSTRHQWLARLVCWFKGSGHDYARMGEGW